jgi:hypothetical protein
MLSGIDRARTATDIGPPEPFPLTEPVFQAIARRLGQPVGIKRCRSLLRRLVIAGVILPAGSYRQKYRNQAGGSGFQVRLYRLVVRVRSLRS